MRKYEKRKMGKVICNNCEEEFEKPLSEIKRNKKLGRNNYCSRRCSGIQNIKNFGEQNDYDISQHSNNRGDEFTKFKYHFRNINKRLKEVTVTIEDLKGQWEKQKGICPFTGVNLILSSYSKISKDPIFTASLDRIDSTKGYVKGNIRWVSRSINYMKNNMSEEDTWKLCKMISENYNKYITP